MSGSPERMPLRFDTGALVAPAQKSDVRTFFRSFAARHPSVGNPRDPARRVAAIVGIIAGVVGVLAMLVGVTQEIDEGNADMAAQLVGMGGVVALMLGAVGVSLWFVIRVRRRRGTPERHYRLARFATDNRLRYDPGPYLASHLTPWQDRGRIVVTRMIREPTGRRAEFANFELTYGTAGSRHTRFGGYCAFRLRTPLPHIVLESVRRRPSHLTSRAVPVQAQRLSLEGDFDRYYRLYCPAGYERDALYLFTPDVMARMVDHVRGFDVEIIDDWLFLTRSRDVVTLDPATWDGIATATNALTDKIDRWERWRDDRSDGPVSARLSRPVVSKPGRRLDRDRGRGPLLWGVGIGGFLVVLVLVSVFAQR